MREVELFFWMLPAAGGGTRPYRSSWKMTREEAAQRGAIEPVQLSREVRLVPETPQEEREAMRRSETGPPRP